MAINRSGFNLTNSGLEIDKDPTATLTYTFDWSSWLEGNDTISSTSYTVAARRNDPTPVQIVSQGVLANTSTYVELSGGQDNKTYIVSCSVTTQDGITDSRTFRLNVKTRSA